MKANTSASRQKTSTWLIGGGVVVFLVVLCAAGAILFHEAFSKPNLGHLRAPTVVFCALVLALVVAAIALVGPFFFRKGGSSE